MIPFDDTTSPAALDRVRALVLRYGWNAMAYQVVNRGIDHWFSRRGDAVVGFVRAAGVRVVAGAPACPAERVADVIDEWERDAADFDERVVYFGAAGRMFDVVRKLPSHSVVVLGAQPIWDPHGWPEVVARHRSIRQQLHRAANKGISVDEWPLSRAQRNVELQAVLDEWLGSRGLPSMHFLIEPQTLDRLEGRRVFVATRPDGPVVAFIVASPVPVRQGWLTEQFVRGRAAPNGTVELLLDFAARRFAAEGATYLTMGLVPLASQNWAPQEYDPAWLNWTMRAARKFGRRFYNFAGLEQFKAKLRPDGWEPIYAISNERRFSPRSMWAIASAFAGGSPVTLVARGAMRLALRHQPRTQEG